MDTDQAIASQRQSIYGDWRPNMAGKSEDEHNSEAADAATGEAGA